LGYRSLPLTGYESCFKADTDDNSTRVVDYLSPLRKNATAYRKTIWRKENFERVGYAFIREGIMQNAMHDANMVHARTVRPHKPRKNFKFLAYRSVAYTRSLNNDN
jgi:hypothetical protein